MSDQPEYGENLQGKRVEELIDLLKNVNFEVRQNAQRELRQRGLKVLLELRHAMTDSRDSEQVNRLQNLIHHIQGDHEAKEQTRRFERHQQTIDKEAQEIVNTLTIWELKLRQLRPTTEDCQLFIENWESIQNYLFWLRRRLNEVELQRSMMQQEQNGY